jgi:hypothetical protein
MYENMITVGSSVIGIRQPAGRFAYRNWIA